MAEKPILFSGPMVRAIFAGTKTQTRRVAEFVPRQPGFNLQASTMRVGYYFTGHPDSGFVLRSMGGSCWNDRTYPLQPRYRPGDTLWVRETWATRSDLGKHVEYRASHQEPAERPFAHIYDEETRWRSSMFMPHWASRITLEVTDVRVQRVQDISEDDARAEGVLKTEFWTPDLVDPYRAAYRKFWDSINAKRGFPWPSNPWVWAYTFRVNEDRDA